MRLEIFFTIGYVCKIPKGGGGQDLFSSKSISCADIQFLKNWPTDDNPYSEQMVGQIYSSELQLNNQFLLILKLRFWT